MNSSQAPRILSKFVNCRTLDKRPSRPFSIYVFAVILFLTSMAACAKGFSGERLQDQGQLGACVPIGEIVSGNIPEKTLVVVRGEFLGWQGCGEGSTLLTRSDWALKDKTGCIMVTGRPPKGLTPVKAGGEPVEVHGIVLKIEKGSFHGYVIKALSAVRCRD